MEDDNAVDRFKNMDRKAASVISTVTGVEIEMNEEEDKVDMCQALREMMEESAQEERVAAAKRMLVKEKFSYEEIAELSALSVEEVQALAVSNV